MISISMCNTKMGHIPSFSLLPGVTCSLEAPCASKGCYMKPLIAIRKSLRASLSRNTDIAMNNPEEVYTQVCGWLAMYKPTAFRIHVSGDFFNAQYLEVWNRIAKKNPSVRFFAFTKQFGVLRSFIKFHKLANNFTIILSAWLPSKFDNWVPPFDLQRKFPIAWIVRDGDSGVEDIKMISKYSKKFDICLGRCDTCGLCVNRDKKTGDVVLYKH